MKRTLNILLGALLMFVVAMTFAFTTMRVAIHGGQVEVPSLVGATVADAQRRVAGRGLSLALVSRFYSTTVPAGHILSQVPAPGVIVRKEWVVRAIESLGPQKVTIPDVRGMPERPAAIAIRRVSLDVGTIAHLPAPGDAEVVLAQTPPPNASGVDSPRVSLLLSQKDDTGTAFVMPSLIGLSATVASSRAAGMGLYVVGAPPTPGTDAGEASPGSGLVSGQSPQAGHRVAKGEAVRLTFAN